MEWKILISLLFSIVCDKLSLNFPPNGKYSFTSQGYPFWQSQNREFRSIKGLQDFWRWSFHRRVNTLTDFGKMAPMNGHNSFLHLLNEAELGAAEGLIILSGSEVSLTYNCEKGQSEWVGTHYYKKTGRWEANIRVYDEKRNKNRKRVFGQYFIQEAAARNSDKARLVLHEPEFRRLNYPETEYDMGLIKEWKKLSLEKFLLVLRKQSKRYSEKCTVGLTKEAAHQLMQKINEYQRSTYRHRLLWEIKNQEMEDKDKQLIPSSQ